MKSLQEKSIVSIARFLTLSLSVGLIAQSVLFVLSAIEVTSLYLKIFLGISAAICLGMTIREIVRQIKIEKKFKKLVVSLRLSGLDVVESRTRRKYD